MSDVAMVDKDPTIDSLNNIDPNAGVQEKMNKLLMISENPKNYHMAMEDFKLE